MKLPQLPVKTIAIAGSTLVLASAALFDHLGAWESGKRRVLTVYADKLANGIPTVCNGLTRHVTTTPIIVGERWTDAQCEAEEVAALIKVQRKVAACFRVGPPQSVFDMASSHAWNFGPSATCGSGAMTAWNRGEWERGCRRISRGDDGQMVWSFVTDPKTGQKVFVRGLANRRADETVKCLAGVSLVQQPAELPPAPAEPAVAAPPAPATSTPTPTPQPAPTSWWRRLLAWIGFSSTTTKE